MFVFGGSREGGVGVWQRHLLRETKKEAGPGPTVTGQETWTQQQVRAQESLEALVKNKTIKKHRTSTRRKKKALPCGMSQPYSHFTYPPIVALISRLIGVNKLSCDNLLLYFQLDTGMKPCLTCSYVPESLLQNWACIRGSLCFFN